MLFLFWWTQWHHPLQNPKNTCSKSSDQQHLQKTTQVSCKWINKRPQNLFPLFFQSFSFILYRFTIFPLRHLFLFLLPNGFSLYWSDGLNLSLSCWRNKLGTEGDFVLVSLVLMRGPDGALAALQWGCLVERDRREENMTSLKQTRKVTQDAPGMLGDKYNRAPVKKECNSGFESPSPKVTQGNLVEKAAWDLE